MSLDSLALGNFASPHRLTHDGIVYEMRLIDQAAKAEWARRLFERAIEATESLGKLRGEAWKESKLRELDDEFIAGAFGFFTDRSLKLMGTAGGMELLLGIVTGRDLSELAPLLLNKPAEVKAMLHLIIRQSFPGVTIQEQGGDAAPN